MALDYDTVLQYLADEHYLDTEGFDGDTPIFSSGLLSSFTMVDVMLMVEEAMGKRMNPRDFTVPNMDTINRIVAYANSQATP